MKWDFPVEKSKKKPASSVGRRVEERIDVPEFMRSKPSSDTEPKKKKAKSKRVKESKATKPEKTKMKKKAGPTAISVDIPLNSKPNGKAVHSKQHKRNKKRRRRGSRILYYLLFGTLASVIIVTLSVTVLFNVDTITVTGDSSADQEQIILESGIKMGDNLFRLDAAAAARRILENHVQYDAVSVERNFPTGITITLKPAKIVAIVFDNGTYYSVSSGGRIIETAQEAPQNTAYPLVFGCSLPGAEYGDLLTANDTNKLDALQTILTAIEENALSGVSHIDIRDLSTIRLFWRGQAELKFGSLDGISYEVHCVKKLLDNQLAEDDLVIIDATLMNGTYYKRPVAELNYPDKGTKEEETESEDENTLEDGENSDEESGEEEQSDTEGAE